MILDVNTEFFELNGSYEYAKKFYEDAFHFAEKIYGKENIISVVMHADEQNTAMSEKYGKPVYHYHLHIMALPIVEKEIRWSKRCKDKELIGTIKEVVNQVSHSNKWRSAKALDENGNPILNARGKPIYHSSYSILQDEFYEYMTNAGYKGFVRGERGSTTENLTSLEYKIKKDEERLAKLKEQIQKEKIDKNYSHDVFMTFGEINSSGKKNLMGKYVVNADDYEKLTSLAKDSYIAKSDNAKLKEENKNLRFKISVLQLDIADLKEELKRVKEKCNEYLIALSFAPQKVKDFIDDIIRKYREQEARIALERKAIPLRPSRLLYSTTIYLLPLHGFHHCGDNP